MTSRIDSVTVLEMVSQMEVQDELLADARAVGWVTISTDLQFGTLFVVGTYPSRIEAELAAADQQEQMDEFVEDGVHPGWRVKAYRIMPKEDS